YAQRGVGMVTLKVYDLMGRDIATLVNEQLAPGTYETTFDGSALSSGTYFYKLTSGDFTQTKKLTLLK
ncbi:MAG: T9SS type A sorting domain-containing protein, partial [Ignavibacteria bacterium]